MILKNKKRIVIKVGSSLLVEDEKVRSSWLLSLVEDISSLKKEGKEVIIVSSGAVALGKSKLFLNKTKTKNLKLKLEEKQAAAAIGQIALMSEYQHCFSGEKINVGQILITGDDSTDRNRYLNTRNTINTLLKNGIVPIVNENDTIAVEEIKIGDNDRLAARIAQIAECDLLILLSDIEGLYDKNPKTNSDAKFIAIVEKIDETIEKMAGGAGSSIGTGGMITKIKAAKMAFNLGCDCIIASGLKSHPIKQISQSKKFTLFKAPAKKISAKKQWIADCLNVKGEAIINEYALAALIKNSSLLPVGIVKIHGEFKKGDIIFVKDEQGKHIANGIAKYNSSSAINKIGKNNEEELINRDDLVLFN